MRQRAQDFFALLRVSQWVKNTFVLAPVFFAFQFRNNALLLQALFAALAFCAISSAVYILNDWMDRKDDREHPQKKHRPLAAGRVSPAQAWLLFVALLGIGSALIAIGAKDAWPFLVLYFINNVNYSLWMRHVALLDIFSIAAGFVLRVLAGAGAVHVPASPWILVITFLFALFIALGKRRDDVLAKDDGHVRRKSIQGYNKAFVDAAMVLMGGVIIVAYILYTLSADVVLRFGSSHVYATAVFVIMGVFRYLQLALVLHDSGNPTTLVYRDRFLQGTLLCWGASFFVLYLTR
jgi:4-hydroxybenzoate polyprenyltransferase